MTIRNDICHLYDFFIFYQRLFTYTIWHSQKCNCYTLLMGERRDLDRVSDFSLSYPTWKWRRDVWKAGVPVSLLALFYVCT